MLMETEIRVHTRVQPGGKLEIIDPQLPVGEDVDVIIKMPNGTSSTRRAALDIIDSAPGHLMFRTADEVDAYIREERDAWER
jgi:hypothetical protein